MNGELGLSTGEYRFLPPFCWSLWKDLEQALLHVQLLSMFCHVWTSEVSKESMQLYYIEP